MIIDSKMVFMEDQPLSSGSASGIIDLYGQDIPVYPNSDLDEINARGTGTPVEVHVTLKQDPNDGQGPSGEWTITIERGSDGTNFPNTVAVVTAPDYLFDHAEAAHMFFVLPANHEDRYLRLTVDASGVIELGTVPTTTAWLFAQ